MISSCDFSDSLRFKSNESYLFAAENKLLINLALVDRVETPGVTTLLPIC